MPAQSILFISLYYEPEITGNAAVMTSLAQMLSSRGHDVRIIAGTPHYRLPEVPPKYRGKLFVREELTGVQVTRCYAYPGSGGIFAKLLNYLTFVLTSFIGALLSPKPDVVVSVTPPFLLGAVGWCVARIRGAKFIYNAQDLFPESYVSSGVVRHKQIVKAIDSVQRWIYRRADAIAVVCNSFKGTLVAKGIDGTKITWIPNFTDQDNIRPMSRQNPFSAEHGLNEKFVVLYAGNIGFTHGAEIIADVAKRFQSYADVRFLVVGEGSGLPELQLAAAGVPIIDFLPPQPTARLRAMLASCDAGLVTTKPNVGSASFPSRIYGLMAAARPVVATIDLDSDAADLLRQADCGLVVTPGDADSLCAALERLYRDHELRERLGISGRKHLESYYSKEAIASRYETLFNAVQFGESHLSTAAEND